MSDNNAPANGATNAKTEKVKTLDDIKRRFFPASAIGTEFPPAFAEIMAICERANVKPRFNFNPEAEFPAGYGIAVVPVSKRDEAKKENVAVGVAVAAIPELVTINAADGGPDFIRDTVTNAMILRVANAVRPKADGSTAASIPFEVSEFIETAKRDASLSVYADIAKDFVKALRGKGLSNLTGAMLRQVLSSTAAANSLYPKLKQNVWLTVLAAMEQKAISLGKDPAIFKLWAETRDAAALDEVDDVDTDSLLADVGLA